MSLAIVNTPLVLALIIPVSLVPIVMPLNVELSVALIVKAFDVLDPLFNVIEDPEFMTNAPLLDVPKLL